jgi:hypothetical protein
MRNKAAVFIVYYSFCDVHTDLFVPANARKTFLVFPLLRLKYPDCVHNEPLIC